MKKSIATILLCAMLLLLGGCGAPQKEIIVYGSFKDNYTTNKFEVVCDWKTINPILDSREYEKYGLYSSGSSSFAEFEEYSNIIALFSYR